jgi:matrixin
MLRLVRLSIGVLFIAFLSRGVAPSSPDPVAGFTEDSTSPVQLRPGMTFSDGGVTLLVPPPGMSVGAEAVAGKGSTVELALETRRDGSVLIHRGSFAERTASVSRTSSSPCGDGAYSLAGARWGRTYNWYMSTANFPGNISGSGAEGAFKRAVSNVVNGFNNCNKDPGLASSSSYLGRTSSQVDVTNNAACYSPDGRNEIGFKRLPSNYLAYSCRWWSNGRYVEGDSAYNTYYKWYIKRPSSCSWRWSLANVTTHEMGHNFGLSHVSEASHPNLTMSPTIWPCQGSEKTLGLGDLRGLEALY